MEEKIFHSLLREVCEEEGIEFKKLSYNWILQLIKGNKIRYITGTKFDLNTEASSHIACDKYATYEVLKSQNVSVIEHTMLFNPSSRNSFIDQNGINLTIVSEFLKHGTLVIKPNFGCEGMGVYLCHTLKEAEIAVYKLFKTNSSISICPYYDIKNEYRNFYLDGDVYLIYGKTKPYVIGNGISPLKDLIKDLKLPEKTIVTENLKELDLNYILKENEKFEISWKHNLSGGAIPTLLPNGDVHQKVKQLAINAGNALNMKFATIDIIETTDNNFYVLEVNSGIGATIFTESTKNGTIIMKDLYKKALNIMFQ